jgi:hypothetical protein
MRVRVAVLACLALLSATATAAAAPSRQTIRVISVTVSLAEHDVHPKGASKGDTVVYRDKLLNAVRQFGKKKGAAVGSDHGTMTFTSQNTARFDGSAALPGGTLTLAGRVRALANGGLVIPIAGGSGKFAQAKGTLTVGPGKNNVLNIYELTLSSLPVA